MKKSQFNNRDKIVIGVTDKDFSIRSEHVPYTGTQDRMSNHSKFNLFGRYQWRYNTNSRVLYFWTRPSDQYIEETKAYINKKYSSVKSIFCGMQEIEYHDPEWDDAHGIAEKNFNTLFQKIITETTDQKYNKIVIGVTGKDFSIKSQSTPYTGKFNYSITHGKLGLRGDYEWRYNTIDQSLYFWTNPPKEIQEETRAYINKKYSLVKTVKNILCNLENEIDYEDSTWNSMHGISENFNNLFKKIITETTDWSSWEYISLYDREQLKELLTKYMGYVSTIYSKDLAEKRNFYIRKVIHHIDDTDPKQAAKYLSLLSMECRTSVLDYIEHYELQFPGATEAGTYLLYLCHKMIKPFKIESPEITLPGFGEVFYMGKEYTCDVKVRGIMDGRPQISIGCPYYDLNDEFYSRFLRPGMKLCIDSGKGMYVMNIYEILLRVRREVDEYLKKQNINESILLEMPNIVKQGTKIFAGEKRLKDSSLTETEENIVFFINDKENAFMAKGFMLAYFTDSKESAQKIANGEIGLLTIPDRPRFALHSKPITDVWKKSRADKGQEHILGMIQGFADEKEIYIDKMSTRSPFRKNGIVSKLIDTIKRKFPSATVNYSGPTKQGNAFINKYTGKQWEPAYGESPEY